MAFTYGFYNSKNKDRRYNADQMSQLFDGILNDGVFNKVGELMMVVPGTGLQVLVKSGRAWFNSTWSYNDAAYPLNLSTPDVAVPRIDAVVLEVDHTETVRRNRLLVVKGTASSNPEKPTLVNTDLIHQHPLAYVTLQPGAQSISAGDIEIMVGKDECPFVTGILQTASLEDLYEDWDNQFSTWFEDIKSQLDGDVATNLLNEINKRVKIADKASTSEVTVGTNDTKWVTPKGVAAIAGKVKDSSSGSLISTRSILSMLGLASFRPDVTTYPTMNGIYIGTNSYFYTFGKDSNSLKLRRFSLSQYSNATEYTASTTSIASFAQITGFNVCTPAASLSTDGVFLRGSHSNIIANIIVNLTSLCAFTCDSYNSSLASAGFITSSYYGFIIGTTCYYVSKSSKISITTSNASAASTISLASNMNTIIGVYSNTVITIGFDSNKTARVYKIDLASKTYQAFSYVMNTTGHTSNVNLTSLSMNWRPMWFDASYAYVLPYYNSGEEYVIPTNKILRISLTTGENNWDSITKFTKYYSNSFTPIYIGKNGSYNYILINAQNSRNYLLKITSSTQSMSISNVKIIGGGANIALGNFYYQAVSEKTINISGYPNLIPIGESTFIDVNTSEIIKASPMVGTTSDYPYYIGNKTTDMFSLLNFTDRYNGKTYTCFDGGTSIYDIIKS